MVSTSVPQHAPQSGTIDNNGLGASWETETVNPRYLAMLHRKADEYDTVRVCYFVGGEAGAVKIGYTCDLKARLAALQWGSPIPLRVLAVASGGDVRETAYHVQFNRARLHGEWFERTPEILSEIERLNALPPAPARPWVLLAADRPPEVTFRWPPPGMSHLFPQYC